MALLPTVDSYCVCHVISQLSFERQRVTKLRMKPTPGAIEGGAVVTCRRKCGSSVVSILLLFMAGIPLTLAANPSVFPHMRQHIAAYTVTNLSAGERRSLVPTGLNNNGDVVGRMWNPGTHAFMFRRGQLTDLGVPKGFAYSGALGVTGTDVVLANAWNVQYHYTYFLVYPARTAEVWIQLRGGLPGYVLSSAEQIAENGDIVGTLRRAGSSGLRGLRAVVWKPNRASQYRQAEPLPLTPGFGSSHGSVISSGGGQVIVGGCQFKENSINCLGLWARKGTHSFQPSLAAVGGAYSSFRSIGGWGTHVYAVGETGDNDTAVWAWASHVAMTKGGLASIVDIPALPTLHPGDQFEGVTGVSATTKGQMVAVGAYSAEPRIGLFWRGSTVQGLQRLLPSESPWSLNSPVAVNGRGQILGLGEIGGRSAAFLLTPKP